MPGRFPDLIPPDALEPAELRRALAPGLGLRADAARITRRSFYDTFDGRLHRAGVSLVHEDGRLTLLDEDGGEHATAPLAGAPRHVPASALAAGPLGRRIAPVADHRALTRIAQVRCRTRRLDVLNEDEKTVARLVLEEPHLASGPRTALRPRLRPVGVRGYDAELARVVQVLSGELALAAADASLQDEAVLRAGGIPGGVSSRLALELDPDDRADGAAIAIARRLAEVVEANLPGAITDLDSEFLHDLRVGVRRTRSLLRELRAVFPSERLAHFRSEFTWLQAVTGPSRDLDVYLLEFEDLRAILDEQRRADLEPLRSLLRTQRTRERRRMVRALRSRRMHALLADWTAFLSALEDGTEPAPPGAGRPVGAVAGARIGRVFRRIVTAGSRIDDASSHAELHGLRKRCKELRYLLEFFASLYPARVTKPMVRTLKALQDTLGRFQDREVQAARLRALGDEIRELDDGTAALLAMGQLVERLEEQQDEARAEFAERFGAFAAKRQRKLVQEVFG